VINRILRRRELRLEYGRIVSDINQASI